MAHTSMDLENQKSMNSEGDIQTDPDHEKRGLNMLRVEQIVKKFATYEDFLNNQINETDMYYLEDRGIARTIKELGFHNNAEKVTREQFAQKKVAQAVVRKIEEHKSGAKYLHTDRDIFLLELARREDANLNGRLVTVIYLRDRNAKGQEISSYIDYAQRLLEEDFAEIFAGRERLVPKTSDISHFNWDTNVAHSNNTRNFDVIYQGPEGLQLKCRKDRRIIHVNPNRKIKNPNLEDTSRTVLRSRNYAQVVLFDHFIRFWAKDDDPDDDTTAEITSMADGTSETKLNLYDAVTAAIYEDDLLEIAKNALGGHLHQANQGQWAPADMATIEKATNRASVKSQEKPQQLETSVLGTIRDLYDAHKSDLSFGTLGNFTFMQLIEQLGHLLPPEARKQWNKEIEQIASDTAVSKGPVVEKLSRVVVDPDSLMETQVEKLSTQTDDNCAEQTIGNDANDIFLPQTKLEPIKSGLFRDRKVENLFDPDFHKNKLNSIVPKKDTVPDGHNHASLGFRFEENKTETPDKPSISRGSAQTAVEAKDDQASSGPYKELEKRMTDKLRKKHKDNDSPLPIYPQPVNFRATEGS